MADKDLLWEAMMQALDWNALEVTASQRGAVNAALKELREVGATPDEIARRAEVYADRFAGAALTPSALAKWWPELGRKPGLRDMSREQRQDHESLGLWMNDYYHGG